MIYELNGKFGDFTVEAESDLITITIMNMLSPDGFINIVHPRVQYPRYGDPNYTEATQELYAEHITQAFYINENLTQLIDCIKSYIPGTSVDRIEFNNQYNEAIVDLDEEDKKHMKLILLDSYRDKEQYDSLLERFHHVLKLLMYELKQKEQNSEQLIKKHAAKKIAALNENEAENELGIEGFELVENVDNMAEDHEADDHDVD